MIEQIGFSELYDIQICCLIINAQMFGNLLIAMTIEFLKASVLSDSMSYCLIKRMKFH